MGTLNQYAISQALDSKMQPIREARFGNLALLETTAEAIRAGHSEGPINKAAEFTYAKDRVIVQAFEAVRQGFAPDAILWNTHLSHAFYQHCRELGLDAPHAALGRRLINVRKNKKRYEKHGIVIAPATVREPHPSILPQHAHLIEFALVRLRFRYGVSIDDILLDPLLSDQFETLILDIAPDLSTRDVRLGALYIRKSRSFAKKQRSLLASLDPAEIDDAGSQPVRLSQVSERNLPEGSGIISLQEENRFLYISRTEQLRRAVHQLRTGHAFAIMANNFWTPCLDDIMLQVVPGDLYKGVSMSLWERRLIHDREPVFNWPVRKTAS